jgi:hypothetical protein
MTINANDRAPGSGTDPARTESIKSTLSETTEHLVKGLHERVGHQGMVDVWGCTRSRPNFPHQVREAPRLGAQVGVCALHPLGRAVAAHHQAAEVVPVQEREQARLGGGSEQGQDQDPGPEGNRPWLGAMRVCHGVLTS